MKKILIISGLFLLAFSLVADAQVYALKSQYNLTVDTITSAAKRLTLKKADNTVLGTVGFARVAIVQIDAIEISGTTGGTAQVQGSLDGVTWYNIGSAFTLTDVAAQTTSVKITDGDGLYISVLFTPTGTMSDKVYAKLLRRT